MISEINKIIGDNLRNVNEFNEIIKLINQPASRGSIGDLFFAKNFAGNQTGLERYRQVFFSKNHTGGTKGVIPDRIRPISKRTLDVKSGYSDSNIDIEQLKNLELLIEKSRIPQSNVADLLEGIGIKGGLKGHDYVFLPGLRGTSREAAKRAFNIVEENAKNSKNFSIYFIDNKGKVWQYLGPDIEDVLVGIKLLD